MWNNSTMSKAAFLSRIHSEFPAVTFNRSRLIPRGWDNDAVILDDRLVVRFPRNDEYASDSRRK